MATSSSSAERTHDTIVLASVGRLGIGVRELLRYSLQLDPNNILNRLLKQNFIQSVRRGLPQNRAYYLPRGQKALGAQALTQRLACAWCCLAERGRRRLRLRADELHSLFGFQAPKALHVLEEVGEKYRVMQVYVPSTAQLAPGILRSVERAREIPRIAQAMRQGLYGFVVALPWLSDAEEPLRKALGGQVVPGLTELARRGNLQDEAVFEVTRVPSPQTLSLSLKTLMDMP